MKLKLLLAVLLSCQLLTAQTRREIDLKTWEFSRDQKTWEKVDIPHDWAIAGPFDKKWDLQRVAIVQNGETEATEKSGRSGALPWIGEGWYRTTISVPEGYDAAELVFDDFPGLAKAGIVRQSVCLRATMLLNWYSTVLWLSLV